MHKLITILFISLFFLIITLYKEEVSLLEKKDSKIKTVKAKSTVRKPSSLEIKNRQIEIEQNKETEQTISRKDIRLGIFKNYQNNFLSSLPIR